MASQYGLEWETTISGLETQWSAEPSLEQIERISRQRLHLDGGAKCAIKYHAQGGFNKLYTVETDSGKWLMRVALPVDPYRKTASEVTTMRYAQENTSIPIPAILGFDSSNKNELQFEWILMDFMPGTALERSWRKLSMSQKEDLVRELARFQAELFSATPRRHTIGNLYPSGSGSYEIGSIVSMSFFWGDRATRNLNRGPFQNSYEWLSARLALVLEDQDNILSNSDDEDERDDAQQAKALAKRLIALLPGIFPKEEVESTILFHDDLHEKNILVDESGNLTAVLDWECVSFFPLWMACQPPTLLSGATRSDEPQPGDYAPEDPADVDEDDPEYNEGVNGLYWEHFLMYERGHLRSIFLSEMERLVPAWFAEYQDGESKRDFELAILHCDGELTMKRVEAWLDAYEKGERYSLRRSIDE